MTLRQSLLADEENPITVRIEPAEGALTSSSSGSPFGGITKS